mmetsp:Transcript_131596/g.357331  ORF Transcript_131596/g.357331 Transcript_131596/m.357331 type:complete len:341 (-) Transcript_131596:42-1064(-)
MDAVHHHQPLVAGTPHWLPPEGAPVLLHPLHVVQAQLYCGAKLHQARRPGDHLGHERDQPVLPAGGPPESRRRHHLGPREHDVRLSSDLEETRVLRALRVVCLRAGLRVALAQGHPLAPFGPPLSYRVYIARVRHGPEAHPVADVPAADEIVHRGPGHRKNAVPGPLPGPASVGVAPQAQGAEGCPDLVGVAVDQERGVDVVQPLDASGVCPAVMALRKRQHGVAEVAACDQLRQQPPSSSVQPRRGTRVRRQLLQRLPHRGRGAGPRGPCARGSATHDARFRQTLPRGGVRRRSSLGGSRCALADDEAGGASGEEEEAGGYMDCSSQPPWPCKVPRHQI